jgi:Fe-S-cluster containining protein
MKPAASPQEPPWYDEGLRFRCTRCGKCCTGAPGFVWVNDEEVEAIADFLGELRDRFIALYTRKLARGRSLRERANGDCIFYAAGEGCTVYPVRPRQCRTWPFWESNVRTAETWEDTCRICPGSGEGDLIPAEEITRRVREISI